MLVTVYGTLKRGYGNNVLLRDASFVDTCTVKGFKLYNSGFPVASPNEDTFISGEVFDISGDASILKNLDRLEGHRGNNPEDGSMYLRLPVISLLDTVGIEVETNMYVGNPHSWGKFRSLRECSFNTETNTYTWSRESYGW